MKTYLICLSLLLTYSQSIFAGDSFANNETALECTNDNYASEQPYKIIVSGDFYPGHEGSIKLKMFDINGKGVGRAVSVDYDNTINENAYFGSRLIILSTPTYLNQAFPSSVSFGRMSYGTRLTDGFAGCKEIKAD